MHQTTEVYHPIDPPVHLDILSSKPLDPSHPQPTLVYFHGGGLTAGSRHVQAQALLPQLLLAEGWAIVCPDYRLLPESGIPEILQDLHELEKWLLQCKAGIDVSRLVMAGSSAGAFVSLLALTSWQSVKPRAFYSQYGMVDTAGEWYRRRKDDTTVFGNIPASALVEDMFTQYFQPGRLQITADALAVLVPDSRGGLFLWMLKEGRLGPFISKSMKAATGVEGPLDLIGASFPPTIIIHGTGDSIVPLSDSRALQATLQRVNVQVRLIEAEGAEHGLAPQENYRDALTEAACFLKEHAAI